MPPFSSLDIDDNAGPLSIDQLCQPTLNDLVTPVWIYDTLNFRIYWANKSGLVLWGSDALEELRARDFKPETSEAVNQTLLAFLEEFKQGHKVSRWWRLSPHGIIKDVFCQFSGIRLEDGRLAMLCEGLEARVLHSEAFMSSAIIASMYDRAGTIISANPTFEEYFGDHIFNLGDMICDRTLVEKLLQRGAVERESLEKDLLVNTLRGERWHSVHIQPINQADGDIAYLVTQQDINNRKQRELEHQAQAATDPLTGLLNRNGIEQALLGYAESHLQYLLFYIDLDGFKPINDTYGHGVGDLLLCAVAERLQSEICEHPLVCRVGGDEFILAVSQATLDHSADDIAQKIVRQLSRVYSLPGQPPLSISASVGFALYPDHGQTLNALVSSADAAMYVAKQRGRRRWIRYRPGMEDTHKRKTLLAHELPKASAEDELILHYQPIVCTRTGTVLMVEALLRWHNKLLGAVSAGETIEAAEDIGLIAEIESWLLNRVCADLHTIRRQLQSPVRAAVNISGLHLVDEHFLPNLDRAVAQAGLTPADLVIELTESALLPVRETHDSPAHRLAQRGYGIAIDDFGTGYSSLAYLHRLPADYVKIDKAFIERLHEDSSTVACIQNLIATLGMESIAEGVETETQSSLLERELVTLQQGHWHGAPVPLPALKKRE
ncbi:EAL domain-containing protein [Exilibacterium tricleocarpae]|uniref:EAL domain-containing protein n=1 Tax=Exilibacterium tricleocarpae TaxID=2591008 RepID=A0A545TQL7_9GAMM|nr:EAL domain-containing protein [Exilibacterium tricleocarpae]TQV79504.1 EAL domain-containing protein [Exilibacterium tricleocarpae]